MDTVPPPDVVLLGAEWQARAMLRAQLIEEGLEVIAVDTWQLMRRSVRPRSMPRLAIVDLKGLTDPETVLDGLRVLMKPQRVLVLTALGTVAPADIVRRGFHVRSRPIAIEDLVNAAVEIVRAVEPPHSI